MSGRRRLARVGFVGCGNHATKNVYPALRFADCELVAVADPSEQRCAYAARVFGAARAYDDYRPLLERERLDAVFVVGPGALHHAAGLAALDAGLHVFLEKPPADTLDGTRELAARAAEADRICAVGFMKRSAQKYVRAKELLAAPEAGTLRYAFVRYCFQVAGDRERTFAYNSIHGIDLLRFFVEPVRSITVAHGSDDRPSVYLQTVSADGTVGQLAMSASAPGVTERVELLADQAMVTVDELATLHYAAPQPQNQWRPVTRTEERPNFALQTTENHSLALQGYLGEVVAFVDAVLGRRSAPDATIDDAVAAMEIVSMLASGRTGTMEVDVP